MEDIKCTRCSEFKSESEFWFNSSRNKVDQPCKCCRNEQKRLRRSIDYQNNKLSKSEIEKSLRLKNYSEILREVILNNIFLKREIEKSSSPLVAVDSENLVIFCPICGHSENGKIPFPVSKIDELKKLFNTTHGDKCSKRQMGLSN